ncbi:MAG: hypothetical protein AAF928_17715 [Myxococcota bacterium]
MAYRDEGEALERREARLAEDLDRIDGEIGRLRRLERQREDLVRALGDVRAVRRQRRLPRLHLHAASPCEAAWSTMEGGGRKRQCGRCGKRVYDVTSLPRAEALALVKADLGVSDEEALQRRLRVRADGTLIAGDCPRGAHRRRRARAVVGGGMAVLGLATLLGAPAHHGHARPGCPHLRGAAAIPYAPQGRDGADMVFVEFDDEVEIDLDEGRPHHHPRSWSRVDPYVPHDMTPPSVPEAEEPPPGSDIVVPPLVAPPLVAPALAAPPAEPAPPLVEVDR